MLRRFLMTAGFTYKSIALHLCILKLRNFQRGKKCRVMLMSMTWALLYIYATGSLRPQNVDIKFRPMSFICLQIKKLGKGRPYNKLKS